MVGPWILFAPAGLGVTDLSDLQFIQDRVDAGEWLEAHGAINAITNEIAITPANGKTLYMYRGKIVISTHTNPPAIGNQTSSTIVNDRVKAAFKIDGTIKDTTNIGIVMNATTNNASQAAASGSSGNGTIGDGRLDIAGLSLVGDGIQDVTIENTLDAGSADATMSGWIKNT